MATTNINVRVDADLNSAISHDGIPFEVKRKAPNAQTIEALAEYEEMKNNKSAYKRYRSFDEMYNKVNIDN